MHSTVYRVLTVLCALVAGVPVGTNLGLVLVLWMLLTGRLLTTRGAVIPGLSALGLSPTVVRRSWAALGQGAWTADPMLANWPGGVVREGAWQSHVVGGYSPVAGDTTGFWRPHLQGCPTQHYHAAAGKALPAIPLGLLARVGSAHGQRLGVPLALVRAPAGDPSPRAHDRALVQQAVAVLTPEEALVVDRAFGVALLQEANVPAWAARLPKHFTARRATPPPYRGRGRPPTRGALVRPLARRRQEKLLAATPPDTVTCWEEDGRVLWRLMSHQVRRQSLMAKTRPHNPDAACACGTKAPPAGTVTFWAVTPGGRPSTVNVIGSVNPCSRSALIFSLA